MTAYYNENDPQAAAWLRELIAAGHIAAGDVDERSIEDVRPEDLTGYTQCHFFAGIGGWSYALRLAGWPDDRPIWTGSPPCQPFSTAGQRRGYDDARHLAPAWLDLVSECRPPVLFGEQVASAFTNKRDAWLDDLQDHLEAEDYAVGAVVLPACGVGAPHIRQRGWIVAERVDDAAGARYERAQSGAEGDTRDETRVRVSGEGCTDGGLADASSGGRQQLPVLTGSDGEGGSEAEEGVESGDGCIHSKHKTAGRTSPLDNHWSAADWLYCRDEKWRPVEPGTFPLADGVSRGVVPIGDPGSTEYANQTAEARVMRLRGYGNAIVPAVAAEVIRCAMGEEQ